MKMIATTIVLLLSLIAAANGFSQEYSYTEASDLSLVGKLMPDTPNP